MPLPGGGARVAAATTLDAAAYAQPDRSGASPPRMPKIPATRLSTTDAPPQTRASLAQTMPSRLTNTRADPRLPALPPISHHRTPRSELSPRPASQAAAAPVPVALSFASTAYASATRPLASSSTAPTSGWASSSSVPVMARAAAAPPAAAPAPAAAPRRAKPPPGAKTSASGFLRNCHRLQKPSDAFSLKGPVRDVDPMGGSGTGKKRGASRRRNPPLSEEEKAVRREQIVRSFLPETLQTRREQKEAEKRARQARREHHEKKRQHAAKEAARQARREKRHRRQTAATESQLDSEASPSADQLDAPRSAHLSSSSPFAGTPASSCRSASLASSQSVLSVYSSLSASTLPPSPNASSTSADLFLNDNHSDVTEPYEETVEEKRHRFEQEMLRFFDAMHQRRVAAACRLQRAYRCHQARRALHARQQLVYGHLYAHQKAAALCVTGFLESVVQTRRRQDALQARGQRTQARATRERAEVAAVRCIERAVRQWGARRRARAQRAQVLGLAWDSRLDDFDRATVLIQRWWRMACVQKRYWRQRTIEVRDAQQQQMAQQRLDTAATSIQRVVRGRQTRAACRAKVAAEREAALQLRRRQDAAAHVLANFLREWALREAQRRRDTQADAARAEAAAETIQLSWRQALQRRVFESAARQTRSWHAAATVLQRVWRTYTASHERRYLRELQQTVQEDRGAEEAKRYQAALRLHCFARRVLAKAAVRRQKAAAGRGILSAFSTLQRLGRGYLARRALGHINAAHQRACEEAAMTAAHYRHWCHSVIDAFLAGKRSFAEAQRRGRARAAEKHFIRTAVTQSLREDAAAARIQQTFRAHQAAEVEKATAAQLEAAKAYVSACATRIQMAWRRYRARQRLATQTVYQARWQRKREDLEHVAWLLWVDHEAAVSRAEQTHRTALVEEEVEESECLHWWERHEQRRCRGLIGADDDEDDEPPPAAMAAVYARAVQAQSRAEDEHWGALYD